MIFHSRMGYERTKKEAHNIYKKIDAIPCPVFNGELIYFNSRGFNHLIRKGRKSRTKNEQKKRFRLIVYAERMIRYPDQRLKIEYQERNSFKNSIKFWTLVENIDGILVKLVIGQEYGKRKEFISIMRRDKRFK